MIHVCLAYLSLFFHFQTTHILTFKMSFFHTVYSWVIFFLIHSISLHCLMYVVRPFIFSLLIYKPGYILLFCYFCFCLFPLFFVSIFFPPALHRLKLSSPAFLFMIVFFSVLLCIAFLVVIKVLQCIYQICHSILVSKSYLYTLSVDTFCPLKSV